MSLRIIAIYPCLNGYICEVGCQKVVFDSRSHLLDTLRRYLDNPKDVEHEFLKNAINPMGEGPAVPHAPRPDRPDDYRECLNTVAPPPTQYVGPLHTGR